MKAVQIRIDDMKNPLGLGDTTPEISWNCEGGIRQSAYRIVALRVPAEEGNDWTRGRKFLKELLSNEADSERMTFASDRVETAGEAGSKKIVWDTGKIASSRMTHILWEGEKLKDRDRILVDIRLWDEKDQAGEPGEAVFELGLLDFHTQTHWISGDYCPKKNVHYPVDCFRGRFPLSGKEIAAARLYVSARGIYDVTINGERLEDYVFAPGMTDYRKQIQVQTYDVTDRLNADGENVLDLRLADGWYRGSIAAYSVTDVFGKETSIGARLEIRFRDGSAETVCTGEGWQWSNDGPLSFADLKDGEHYDARKQPSYSGKARVVEEPDPKKVKLIPSDNVPVKEHEHFQARLVNLTDSAENAAHKTTDAESTDEASMHKKESVYISARDHVILDFGQNLAGIPEFTIHGNPGQKLLFVCGEVLKDGHVDLSGVQEAKPAKGWSQLGLMKKLMNQQPKGDVIYTPEQAIHFICSGGEDHYKTSFAVFGFRYMEIRTENGSALPKIDPAAFHSIAVYSDLEETGDYRCSDESVNQLVRNTRWSMKSNFLDVPTDCPTRERLGWTGDAQIFFNTGSYFMNTAPFFRKWLRDLNENQYQNGLISSVIPYSGVEMMYKTTGQSVGWADAVYLVPYRFYKKYGDRRILEYSWPSMERYTGYLMGHLGLSNRKQAKNNPDNAYTYEKGIHLGEWLEPEEFRSAGGNGYNPKEKHAEECTAYLYLTMKTMEEIAEILGKTEQAKTYARYAAGAKKAYYDLFVKTGTLHTKRQAKIVRPLALGLLDGEEKKNAQDELEQAVEAYDYRVGTGFLSTPFLLPELTKAGHADIAYRVLTGHKSPSWLSEIDAGATTIWENWEGNFSQNHYSPGAVCEWLFDTSAGIRVDGENHFVIAPVPDPAGRITHAEATYRSIYGEVKSRWKMVPAEEKTARDHDGQAESREADFDEETVSGIEREVKDGPRKVSAEESTDRAHYAETGSEKKAAHNNFQEERSKWKFEVTIPSNTTAEIRLPGGRTEKAGPGEYSYMVDIVK